MAPPALPGQPNELDGGLDDTMTASHTEPPPRSSRPYVPNLRRVNPSTAPIPESYSARATSNPGTTDDRSDAMAGGSSASTARVPATDELFECQAEGADAAARTIRADDMPHWPQEPVIDRHDLFHSTVKLAGERWSHTQAPTQSRLSTAATARLSTASGRGILPDMNPSWGSSLLGTGSLGKDTPRSRLTTPATAPPGTAPTAWRDRAWTANSGSQTAREWMDDSRQDLAGFSRSTVSPQRAMTAVSSQSRQSYAVPINPHRLPRQDVIPCQISGRRAYHSGHNDQDIRLFVRLPGGSRFAIWVPPNIPIGPVSRMRGNRDIFKDFWGDDADVRGPFAGRRQQTGRLTPVRALLAQQQADMGAANEGVDGEGFSTVDRMPTGLEAEASIDLGSTASRSMQFQDSLKDLIEKATGIPAEHVSLVSNMGCRGRLEDPERALCNYDVGHGALLFLSVHAPPGRQQAKVRESFNAEKSKIADAISVKAKEAISVITAGTKWVLIEKASGERGKVPRRNLYIEDRRFLANTAHKIEGQELEHRIFDHMEKFRASKEYVLGNRKAKDFVMPLPDWNSDYHPVRLKAEPADEILHFDYSFLRDNFIFDLAGRIRKGFTQVNRAAGHHGVLSKGIKAPHLPAELQPELQADTFQQD